MEKEEIIKKNIGIIKQVAKNYHNRVAVFGISFDDLYQEGLLMVYTNLDNYNPDKASLSTFIHNYASFGMSNFIHDNIFLIHVPSELKRNSYRLMQEYYRFYKENNRNMTEEEMVEFINNNNVRSGAYTFDSKYVKTLLYVYFDCLYDKMLSLYDIENVGDGTCFEDEVLGNIVTDNVIEYIRSVNPKTADAYIKHFGLIDGDCYTTWEMADDFGVTQQAVSDRIIKLNKKLETRRGTIKKMMEE